MQAACSVRAQVVLLADLDAVVAQDGVDGGDVKEKLRQSIVGKIGLGAELLFLRRARAQDDLALFAAFELCGLQTVQE